MRTDLEGLGRLERSLAVVRLGAVPFAASQVLISWIANSFSLSPWLITAAMAAGAAALYVASRQELSEAAQQRLAIAALGFDTAIFSAYALASSYEVSAPTRQGLYLVVVEGALRYALVGAVAVTAATIPVLVASEYIRIHGGASGPYRWDVIVFQLALEAALGILVGWLVGQLDRERLAVELRAEEAERLRDELGRRADLLDAANRCVRALSSSLELDEAFAAFIRELNGLLDFDRVAIVTADGGDAHTLATAGRGEDAVYPAGTRVPLERTLLAELIVSGQTIERQEMDPPAYPEEEHFVELGLRARVAAPVFAGPRAVGMLSVSRAEPNSFSRLDVELLTLLGRLVGSAVQNIRAYESERATVEELRRLSALRADFVSLVSHELRSPMAAVIGSARTLQQRWRELSPEQRDAFIALIADETNRLAALVGDVLDTSRIEAGTFTYSFTDVDLGSLLRDAVAAAELGQDEVPVELHVPDALPPLRADPERLRQVVANLLDNAIKYSPTGRPVEVHAGLENEHVAVTVRDHGPGVPPEQTKLIFEKFGRAAGSAGKPGTGLGLFIARSIAEAHGGTVRIAATNGDGATFRLLLPTTARAK